MHLPLSAKISIHCKMGSQCIPFPKSFLLSFLWKESCNQTLCLLICLKLFSRQGQDCSHTVYQNWPNRSFHLLSFEFRSRLSSVHLQSKVHWSEISKLGKCLEFVQQKFWGKPELSLVLHLIIWLQWNRSSSYWVVGQGTCMFQQDYHRTCHCILNMVRLSSPIGKVQNIEGRYQQVPRQIDTDFQLILHKCQFFCWTKISKIDRWDNRWHHGVRHRQIQLIWPTWHLFSILLA